MRAMSEKKKDMQIPDIHGKAMYRVDNMWSHVSDRWLDK
ncbi:hypothetical protein EC3234A_205c00030 [Escherichia coli]|nr:hypothetical protein EC3234A_205c00030 [Escherichia coli]